MADSNKALYKAMSDAFRHIISELPQAVRTNFEETLQIAFNISNTRNVQLWTRYGTQQRNFIHTGLSGLDKLQRLKIVELCQRHLDPPQPNTRRKLFPNKFQPMNGILFKELLDNQYTFNYSTQIVFNGGDGSFEYVFLNDSDSEEKQNNRSDDSEFEEFYE